MITAGIDVGGKRVKVVILKEGEVIATSIATTGLEEKKGIEEAFQDALKKAGIRKEDVKKIVGTGMGANLVDVADDRISLNIADARGIYSLSPSVRTIIDVGAEEARVIACEEGRVNNYVVNDRCAAGAGTFVDAMARVLEVTPEEFGEMALKSENPSQISAQCTVFAESEVISLISSETSPEDIARSVVDAIAERINSLAMRLTVKAEVALVGGMTRNKGFVRALTRALEVEKLIVPDGPEFMGALGAATVAAEIRG